MISLAILYIWPVIVLRGLGTELQNTGSWLRYWATGHWVVGYVLDYRSLGRVLGTGLQITRSWVRYWTTDHWVMG